MMTSYDEIIAILSDIEEEMGLPKATLKKIYDLEEQYIDRRVRDSIHKDLLSIVSDAAKETNNAV